MDLAHLGDADDQRRKEQRDDQHEQQAKEYLADWGRHIGGDELDPGCITLDRIGDQPQDQAG